MSAVAKSRIADHVTFHGLVRAARLAVLFRQSAFFALLPTEVVDDQGIDIEGFGLVYLEAACYGKPSIASRNGGPSEAVVDGVTGLLVDPHDGEALKSAIESMASAPERCRQMGKAARARVESHFTIHGSIEKLSDIYDEAYGR
jgi:phosphatidylinositol alpha-1,6-mannosyltransferase